MRKKKRSLEEWVVEAYRAGMSYGKYRAAVERLGVSPDELFKMRAGIRAEGQATEILQCGLSGAGETSEDETPVAGN